MQKVLKAKKERYHLVPALSAKELELLWFKQERGIVFVGLNRYYDTI